MRWLIICDLKEKNTLKCTDLQTFCPCAHLKKRSMLFAVCCVATMKHEPTKILVLCRISHKQKIETTSLREGFVVVIMAPI